MSVYRDDETVGTDESAPRHPAAQAGEDDDYARQKVAARENDFVDENMIFEETARADAREPVTVPREVEGAEPIAGQGAEGAPTLPKPGDVEAAAREAPTPTTGINRATTRAEREAKGLAEVEHDLSSTDRESWARAQEQRAADPHLGRTLAKAVAEKSRPLSKEEGMVLAQDRARIKNERSAAFEEAELAQDAGDIHRADEARKRIRELDEEFEINDIAARHAQHEWGSAGHAFQVLSREDYSMAASVRQAKVKKAGELNPAEMREVERVSKRVEELEAQLAKHEAKERDALLAKKTKNPIKAKEAGKRFDSLVEELKAASRQTVCEIA
jgi:hypothetical protein